jgi:hypothetical protein
MRANDTSSAALDRSELKSSQSYKRDIRYSPESVGEIIVIIRLALLAYGDKQLSSAANGARAARSQRTTAYFIQPTETKARAFDSIRGAKRWAIVARALQT